jgi:uncharacterized membrane protein YfcA
MESFDLYAFTSSLSYFHIAILLFVALLASIISGISGYGGGMTLGILVSPFIPIKLLVPLMSVFVFCSNLSRMYYYRDSIFWKKGLYFALIGTPFIILGTNFYAGVSDKVLYFCLGFGLAFVIVVRRIFKKINLTVGWLGLGIMAVFYGTISGVILGPGAVLLTALASNGMVGSAIIGTDSFITCINVVIRLISFRNLGLLNNDALLIGCSIGVVAILGSYIARKIVDKLGVKLHTLIIEICVIVGAVVMIYRAFTI